MESKKGSKAVAFSWITADGLTIHGIDWDIDGPGAVVALAHGLGEHCARYEAMARYYNDRQIAMIAQDFRGHGRSGGKRGHCKDFNDFLDEVDELLNITRKRYPGIPLFLYGHSMGGNIVLNYAIRRKPVIHGLIVSAPSIRLPGPPSRLLLVFARLMVRLYPGFSQNNGLDVDGISRLAEEVEKYKKDALVHNRITARTGLQLLEANEYLDSYEGRLAMPALLMHGSADYLTSAEGTKHFAERLKNSVELKIWEGLYHEIHHEPEREKVFDHTIKWIEKTIDQNSLSKV